MIVNEYVRSCQNRRVNHVYELCQILSLPESTLCLKKENNMSFVHLHCHSDYSLGDSIARIEDYIEAAEAAGMKALAISDTDSLSGQSGFPNYAKSVYQADNSI